MTNFFKKSITSNFNYMHSIMREAREEEADDADAILEQHVSRVWEVGSHLGDKCSDTSMIFDDEEPKEEGYSNDGTYTNSGKNILHGVLEGRMKRSFIEILKQTIMIPTRHTSIRRDLGVTMNDFNEEKLYTDDEEYDNKFVNNKNLNIIRHNSSMSDDDNADDDISSEMLSKKRPDLEIVKCSWCDDSDDEDSFNAINPYSNLKTTNTLPGFNQKFIHFFGNQPKDVSASFLTKRAYNAPTTNRASDVFGPQHSTVVGYYRGDDPIPYRIVIPCKNPTLRDFKLFFNKKGSYRYFFRRATNEFESEVVHEEITDDQAQLPLWQGKVVGKIETIM